MAAGGGPLAYVSTLETPSPAPRKIAPDNAESTITLTMMAINPPTDSLYKFAAVSGVVMVIAALSYLLYRYDAVEHRERAVQTAIEEYTNLPRFPSPSARDAATEKVKRAKEELALETSYMRWSWLCLGGGPP